MPEAKRLLSEVVAEGDLVGDLVAIEIIIEVACRPLASPWITGQLIDRCPGHVATMRAALDAAWDRVGPRFAGAPPDLVSEARTALANGIINGFKVGATDLVVLKHSGLTASGYSTLTDSEAPLNSVSADTATIQF